MYSLIYLFYINKKSIALFPKKTYITLYIEYQPIMDIFSIFWHYTVNK